MGLHGPKLSAGVSGGVLTIRNLALCSILGDY